MTHQRIIGTGILICVFLLILPLLSSERPPEPLDPESHEEIILPEVPENELSVMKITIDKSVEVKPAELPAKPKGYPRDYEVSLPKSPSTGKTDKPEKSAKISTLKPLKPPGKRRQNTPEPKTLRFNRGWGVQVASILNSRAQAINSLRGELKKLGFKTFTESARVKGKNYTRIKIPAFADKAAALKARDEINRKLKHKQVKSFIYLNK